MILIVAIEGQEGGENLPGEQGSILGGSQEISHLSFSSQNVLQIT
jgi:hypothetical protein